MNNIFYAIVVAGGSGTRMGASVPKQFLNLGGKMILHASIEKLILAIPSIHIITVLPKDGIKVWKDYCLKAGFTYPQIIVEGGITRFHSVKNALERVPDGAIVAVHDGVRPLASTQLIARLFESMEENRAVIPVTPMTDTLKVLKREGDSLVQIDGASVDRSNIYGAQTPQLFRAEDLKEAYNLPFDTSYTDDASVASAKKIPLTFILGERYNIKITTPQDLELAELLVSL